MLNIVVTCIILYNLCIVNNIGIEDEWIVEAKNKSSRKINEGEIQYNTIVNSREKKLKLVK